LVDDSFPDRIQNFPQYCSWEKGVRYSDLEIVFSAAQSCTVSQGHTDGIWFDGFGEQEGMDVEDDVAKIVAILIE
jgi:hypothetical protein